MAARDFAEADLYPPVKAFFEGLGYTVRSEVKDCDVAMEKDGHLLIIEMKKSFNISLVYQLMDRQRITTQVYAAIPRPQKSRGGSYTDMLNLCKRLEVGLISVALDSPVQYVEILAFPPALDKAKGAKGSRRREGVLAEMAGRKMDGNTGGSTRRKLMTAYREKCIKAACAMERAGEATAAELIRLYNAPPNTGAIMRNNHGGWFQFQGGGRYTLSDAGRDMLAGEEYGAFVEHYRGEVNI